MTRNPPKPNGYEPVLTFIQPLASHESAPTPPLKSSPICWITAQYSLSIRRQKSSSGARGAATPPRFAAQWAGDRQTLHGSHPLRTKRRSPCGLAELGIIKDQYIKILCTGGRGISFLRTARALFNTDGKFSQGPSKFFGQNCQCNPILRQRKTSRFSMASFRVILP